MRGSFQDMTDVVNEAIISSLLFTVSDQVV